MERLVTGSKVDEFIATLKAAQAAMDEVESNRIASLPAGTCHKCEGAGVFRHHDGSVYQCNECQQTASALVTADGVPYEFRDVSLDAYGPRDGQQAAVRAATGLERDLYVYGGVGAGKTRLAAAVANTWAAQRRTVYFARVPMLLYQLQPGRSAEDIGALERRILTASLVVFDDIGAERDAASDYTRRTLLMLYEGRCDAGLRSVFTGNKSLSELSEQQDDDRLSSRLAGRCVVVQMKASDQRLHRKAAGGDPDWWKK